VPSPYLLDFWTLFDRKQVACNVICEKEMIIPGSDKSKNTDKSKMADLKSSQLLMRAIQLNYQQHWLVEL